MLESFSSLNRKHDIVAMNGKMGTKNNFISIALKIFKMENLENL